MCYLKEIIIKLIRSKKLESILSRADSEIKQSIEGDIVKRVYDYVRKNLSSRITVGDIAKSIPISRSYLSTMFKKSTDKTLVEYITIQKLNRAKDYIREGSYNLTQISEMLSFNSVHYFSKSFKVHFQITPSEYANSIKK